MNVSGETKFFVGVVIITLIILGGAIFFLSKPQAEKEVSVSDLVTQDAWATGSATPKATLVEFGDFECPACGSAFPVVKQVIEAHQQDLKYVFRNYPLDQHKNARLAAEAAEAAGAQGKYWQMYDMLFKNQTNLSSETINGFGIELKLDMDRFTKEVGNKKYESKIEGDIADGNKVGVNATPTFFLNNKKLDLASFSDLKTEVEKVINGEKK